MLHISWNRTICAAISFYEMFSPMLSIWLNLLFKTVDDTSYYNFESTDIGPQHQRFLSTNNQQIICTDLILWLKNMIFKNRFLTNKLTFML